jgi:hypothetical protein
VSEPQRKTLKYLSIPAWQSSQSTDRGQLAMRRKMPERRSHILNDLGQNRVIAGAIMTVPTVVAKTHSVTQQGLPVHAENMPSSSEAMRAETGRFGSPLG